MTWIGCAWPCDNHFISVASFSFHKSNLVSVWVLLAAIQVRQWAQVGEILCAPTNTPEQSHQTENGLSVAGGMRKARSAQLSIAHC